MKAWRKVFSIVLAFALGSLVLAGCTKGKGGESFRGKVSDESFATEQEAVAAFLEEEIDGSSTSSELIGYEKEADLDRKEIEALSLGELDPSSVVRAERGKVSFRNSSGEVVSLAEGESVKSHGLYLLETEGEFHYFVPPTEVGEPVTKSYFDDVLAAEKYMNCTMEGTQTTDADFGEGPQSLETPVSIRIADHAIQSSGGFGAYNGSSGSGLFSYDSYFAERDGGLVYCVQLPEEIADRLGVGRWNLYPVEGEVGGSAMHSCGDYVRILFSAIDFSYFERTEDGLAINDTEKYLAAVRAMGISEEENIGSVKEFLYRLTVKNGRMEKMECKVVCEYGESGQHVGTTMNVDLKNFGSTSVVLPDDLKQLLAESAE